MKRYHFLLIITRLMCFFVKKIKFSVKIESWYHEHIRVVFNLNFQWYWIFIYLKYCKLMFKFCIWLIVVYWWCKSSEISKNWILVSRWEKNFFFFHFLIEKEYFDIEKYDSLWINEIFQFFMLIIWKDFWIFFERF